MVEGGSPVQDPPSQGVGGPPGSDGPDVRAQNGFTLVSFMVERFLVVSFPGLPVSGAAANIGLHLLHPVRPGLHHRGLVNQVLVKAVALERAGAGLPGGPGAGAYIYIYIY